MLGLAWLGRDSSQHAGAAQIPPPRYRPGPRGPWISYLALAGPGAPLHCPARPLRPPDSIWVPGGVWRPWSTSESLRTRFGVSGGVWRPCATPEGLQRAPDTSRRPPQVRSDSHQLAPVQVKVDGEAVRFRNLCPNASA